MGSVYYMKWNTECLATSKLSTLSQIVVGVLFGTRRPRAAHCSVSQSMKKVLHGVTGMQC